MKRQQIRNSRQVVESILGKMYKDGQWFQIHQRQASTGKPTFSLFYCGFRGSQIPLVIDEPLRFIKAELGRFAEEKTLTCFPYIGELVGELTASPRFTPPPPKPNTRLYASRYVTACLTQTGVRFTRKTATGGGSMVETMHEVNEDSQEWNESFSFGWGNASYKMTPAEIAEACRENPVEGNEEAYNRLFDAGEFDVLTHVPYWGGINTRDDVADGVKNGRFARYTQVWTQPKEEVL